MSLQWTKPREESLNDDTGIFVYNIKQQALSLAHAAEVQYYYYPSKSSTEDGVDGYTVVGLSPSHRYEVCVSVATINKEDKRLLEGPAVCVTNATDFRSIPFYALLAII